MVDLYHKKGNRFKKLSADEVTNPDISIWIGIKFTELGGLPVMKTYVTNGTQTFEIHRAPPISGGAYIYQILNEITVDNNPFLSTLIKDEFDKL